MRTISLIIVHCSAVRPNQTSSAKQIDKWHRAQGWKMIGYHYVVRRDGTVEQGRPEWMVGAHCQNHNAHSIGVCYEGGLGASPQPCISDVSKSPKREGEQPRYVPMDTRTPEQKASMLKLLRELKRKYPNAIITGHNTFSSKACPCFDAAAEYRKLSELKAG